MVYESIFAVTRAEMVSPLDADVCVSNVYR